LTSFFPVELSREEGGEVMLLRLLGSFVFVFLIVQPATMTLGLSKLLVGAESVENYSGCGCTTGNLRYTNDQASKFIDKIDDWHTRKFWYKDSNAWSGDMVENELGFYGQDNLYGDAVHLMLISGHGGRSCSPAAYYGYLCKGGAFYKCSYNTDEHTVLGEVSGQMFSTSPGILRFLILCTCHSVPKECYANVWWLVFANGRNFMYVMGYTGLSDDSPTTDEVGSDWASKAAGSGWTLKQAWFWAIEDWWVNDTGGVVSAGDTQAEAISNRDNMKLNWDPNVTFPTWMAASWHSG